MPPPEQYHDPNLILQPREPFMPLDPSQSWQDVAEDVYLHAILNGICSRVTTMDGRRKFSVLPVAVFPSKCDAVCFASAQRLQVLNNKIIHNIANNHEFLETHLKNCADEFVKKLYGIYNKCREEGFNAEYQAGVFRTDYIIDIKKCLKQIKTKTMAVGYGGISSGMSHLHHYTVKSYQHPPYSEEEIERYLPENQSSWRIVQTLIDAHKLYGARAGAGTAAGTVAILVVVPKNDEMAIDQKSIETQIRRRTTNVSIYSRTFEELANDLNMNVQNKALFLKIHNLSRKTSVEVEISVVYYRTGHRAEDYCNELFFQIRLQIEQSKAIKCPSIQYQLAGLPIFRMLLSDQKIFRKLINLPDNASAELFGTYNKYFEINEQTTGMVKKDPKKWLIMSKYEDAEIVRVQAVPNSTDFCPSQKADLMLTEMIKQKPYSDKFIIEMDSTDYGEIEQLELVDDLGIYGMMIGKYGSNEIHQNHFGGFIMRSKPADMGDSMYLLGSEILTSPYLDYRLPLGPSNVPAGPHGANFNPNRVLWKQRREDYIRMMYEYRYNQV